MNYRRNSNNRSSISTRQLYKELSREIKALRHRLNVRWGKLSRTQRGLIKRSPLWLLVFWLVFDVMVYEPRHIEQTTYYVPVAGLPAQLDGLRIVQLSDLHHGTITSDDIIAKAVSMANNANPDIVVLTGDFLTFHENNPVPLENLLSGLRPKLGTYAVLGNHDYDAGVKGIIRSLNRSGIKVLINSNAEPVKGLFLVGLDDYGEGKPDEKAAYDGVDDDACYVTLAHSPIAARSLRERHGLLLTGHTHGGQIRIPMLSRYLLPGLVANKYISGWYLDGNIRTYVNRGIGMTNLPMRFYCHPEVSLFVLKHDPNSAPISEEPEPGQTPQNPKLDEFDLP